MEHERCLKEQNWGELNVTLRSLTDGLKRIEDRVATHIIEGEREGGFRDRLLLLETSVKELRRRFWLSAITGGVIGALIGNGSGDILALLIKWLMGK